MIKEKIERKVKEVNSLVKGGMDINDAVIKAASDENSEVIKRVAESTNVANMLSLLGSTGDKKAHFPIADHKIIFGKMGENSLQKSACHKHDTSWHDSWYVDQSSTMMEKSASHGTLDEPLPISKEAQYRENQRIKVLRERELETLQDLVTRTQRINKEQLTKVAQMAGKMTSAEVKHVLKQNAHVNPECKKRGEAMVTIVSNMAKRASANWDDGIGYNCDIEQNDKGEWVYKKASLIDDSSPLFWEVESLIKGVNLYKEACSILERKSKEHEARSIKPVIKQADDKKPKGLEDLASAAMGGMLGGALKSRQKYREEQTLKPPAPTRGQRAALGLKHKSIFEDLTRNDEILKEKDPVALSNLYESMIDIAPNIAANKEIMKAYLRQVGSQAIMGPYEAKVLSDLERDLYSN